MDVGVVTGEARIGLFERIFRQQRHAVEGLLAVGDDVVAERFDRLARKRLVDAFDFLQADHIGLAVLQPADQMVQPLPDRVDVPSRNPHRAVRCPG